MKILALDSTAKAGSAAVCEDDRLLSLFISDNGNTHSETLLPMALDAMRVAGVTAEDIDLFAVSAGPGSFTGVRIGTAVLKGLAFGRDVPCAAVSTIEALAENARGTGGLICPLMDARREQVYTAVFDGDDGLCRLTEDEAIGVDALAEKLKALANGRTVTLVGDGAALFCEKLRSAGVVCHVAPELIVRECAYSVAQVALRDCKNGKCVSDTSLAPKYLRVPQAERERLEKEHE